MIKEDAILFAVRKNVLNAKHTLLKKRWQCIFIPFSSVEKTLCFPSWLFITVDVGPFSFASGCKTIYYCPPVNRNWLLF